MVSLPLSLADVKNRLQSLTAEEFESLKNVSDYRGMQNILRTNGWLNLFLGGLTLWFGLSGFDQGILKIIQTLFGILIVGQSLWSLRETSAANIRRFEFLLLGAGIWNIFLSTNAGYRGAGLILGLLGVAQLWDAYQFHKLYLRYSQMNLTKPPPEIIQFYDVIWNSLAKTSDQSDDAYIEMQIQRRWWRGLLLPEYMILALKRRNGIIFAKKSDAIVVPTNPKLPGKWIEMVVQIDSGNAIGKLSRQFYDKYVGWKGGEVAIADAPVELQQTRTLRRIIRIVAIIILGLVGLYMLSLILLIIKYS